MPTYEIAFDVILTHHEWIAAVDEAEAEELAQKLLLTRYYEDVLVPKYERDLARGAYVEAECVCPNTGYTSSVNLYDYIEED